MSLRDEFEKWARDEGHSLHKHPSGDYRDVHANLDWRVWQAAHASLMARIPVEAIKSAIMIMDVELGMLLRSIEEHPSGSTQELIKAAEDWSNQIDQLRALTQLLEQKQ